MKHAICSLILVAFPMIALADYEGRVVAVEAFANGGGTAFTFAQMPSPERVVLTTSSPIIQGTLLRAFMTGAKVKVDTEGTSPIIRRVEAFEPGTANSGLFPFYGDYQLNRLATQRGKDGEYLETFLIRGNVETQFLVFDATLQPVFFAIFEVKKPAGGLPIQIKYDDKTVLGVRVGEKAR